MFIHSEEEIAKDIDIMDDITGHIISKNVSVRWADFSNHEFAVIVYDEKGQFLKSFDDGLVTKTFSRKIIPVYKGE